MAGNNVESGRSVTSKITSILLTFTEGSEHSVTDIARRAGLPISTAHRLTGELASWRLLERNEQGLYRAGRPLRMFGHVDDRPPSITERAPCVLEDLCGVTKSRARLGVLRGLDIAYIEKLPGSGPVSLFSTAATLPAHPTALGRALLAFSPAKTVELILRNNLRAYTDRTVTSPERIRQALAVTRSRRLAMTRSEFEPGVCEVAMPVFGRGGAVVAAIELATTDVSGVPSLMAALAIACRSLSRELAGDSRNRPPVLPQPRPGEVEDRSSTGSPHQRALAVAAGI